MTRSKSRTRRFASQKAGGRTELAPGQLTTNFWESEVSKSTTALRRDIDNEPSSEEMARAKLLAEKVLQPIRDEFGAFSPESWYRSEALERMIASNGFIRWCKKHGKGNSADSWKEYFPLKSHPKGEAADFEIVGLDNLVLFDWIQNNLQYDQLIIEGYRPGVRNSGWIHVSYREDENRNQAFGIDEP